VTTEIHTLVGAYVLDAVDDIERASFERHLRECDACRTEVDEFRETTAHLAHDTWSVPPPWLRDNVMGEISRTRQAPPVVPEAPAAPPVRGVSRRRWLISAAAAVVAAAGAGSAVYAVQDQRVRDQRQIAEAARLNEARVRQILSAPDVVLKEQPVSTGGRVTVASSRLHDAGVVLLAAGNAPAGKVYQMWTIRGGAPASASVLAEGQSADVVVVEGLPGASDVGLTLEPPGGSAAPTTPLVADVKLA
jgi:anti-sigma-K factor RskA